MSIIFYLVLALVALLVFAALWTRRLARAAEREVPRPGALQPVEGGVMHYVDTGPRDGRAVVLIHGIGAQLQHFTYGLADLLAEEFRVIAVDRPGCGYSRLDEGDGASLADQARMIDELLARLDVEGAIVVGHSLGGAVALRMALDHPGRLGALALLCPLSAEQTKAPDALKGLQIAIPWLRHFLGATIAVPIAKLTTNKLLAQVFHPENAPPDFLERSGSALGLRPSVFIAACSDMIEVQREMPAQVARYKDELGLPGGILYGAEDAILSPGQHGQAMTEYGLSCELLPDRGHMIPITAVQDCADFIRRVAKSAT